MRSVVVERAHCGATCNDAVEYAIQVTMHVNRRDAQNIEALAPKQRVARDISGRLITAAVRLAIDLDDQTVAEAGEIGGDPLRRELPPELESVRALPQGLPQQHFG